MFGIILAVVALILCTITSIDDAANGKPIGAVIFGLLAIMNLYILVVDIKKYKSDEPKTYIEKNVVEYHIDSTITINQADTTKTYTITYLK